jgi:diguanylate cyclase (GGDEF)-like protein
MELDVHIIKLLAESSSWEDELFLFDFFGKVIEYKSPGIKIGVISVPISKTASDLKSGIRNVSDLGTVSKKIRMRWCLNEGINGKGLDLMHFMADSSNQSYFLVFDQSSRKLLEPHLESVMGFLSKSLLHIFKYKSLLKNQHLAHIDDVTGLFNQRRLMQDLEHYIRLGAEKAASFSVMFIDIDYFKRINDGHGHLIGTEILMQLAQNLKTCLRDDDLTYRYGGDEFVVLLPSTEQNQVLEIGQRVVDTVKNKTFSVAIKDSVQSFNLSVSVGIATFPQDAARSEEILSMADRMMYQAKMSGRGKVCHISQYVEDPNKRTTGT